MTPGRPQAAVTGDGPEPWQAVAGREWCYWDLWMCLACVRDAAGDWDAFDALLVERRTTVYGSGPAPEWEPLWSHLLDLRGRLALAGLTAADLADRAPTGTVTRARAKLHKRSLPDCDRTEPMRNPPSARLLEQALDGARTHFPADPRPAYEAIAARVDVHLGWWDWRAARELIHDLETAVEDLAGTAVDTTAELAVRRTCLTHVYELAEVSTTPPATSATPGLGFSPATSASTGGPPGSSPGCTGTTCCTFWCTSTTTASSPGPNTLCCARRGSGRTSLRPRRS